jgi:hypothetical protein
MFMKMQRSMAQVPIKGLNEEDRLRVLRRHIFYSVGIQQLQPNRIKRIDGIIPQQLFDRTQFTWLRQPPDGVVLISNNYPVTIGQVFIGFLRSYDAWFRGDRSYCLILYRSAL